VSTVETDQFLKEEMKVSGTPAAAVSKESNLDAAKEKCNLQLYL
jgi:hypothetical protein